MADTFEDGSLTKRLWSTPLRDLARGRITRRLDWRRCIAAAGLPAPLASLVERIVKRTRLWRVEKADVAEELVAHFADGLAAGTRVEELTRAFGNETAAVRLIRRAKKRNRPLAWHAMKYVVRGTLVLMAIHGVLLVRFMFGAPTVRTDYLAQINAPIERVPEKDRAWPLYREAILGLGMGKEGADQTLETKIARVEGLSLLDVRPSDPEWPLLTAWLDAHQPALATLRQAAAKPALGFVLGPDGPSYDPAIKFPERPAAPLSGPGASTSIDHSLISVLLPYLNHARYLAHHLSLDLRYARQQRDADRVLANLEALDGLARQLNESSDFIVVELVGIGIHSMMLADLQATLVEQPELFSDAQLVRLAHRLEPIAGDSATTLFNTAAEQMMIRDIIQRLYTDDGHGDGRLTPAGVTDITRLMGMISGKSQASGATQAGMYVVGSAIMTVNTRREVQAEFDRLYGLLESDLARPAYALDFTAGGHSKVQERVAEINASAVLSARYFLVSSLMPTLLNAQFTAERLIATRDGTQIAIALELYRRRNNGQYPPSLDVLVPTFLPTMPKDRITGEPIRYRLIDGKPVVYSVGVDRDDDNGRRGGRSNNWIAREAELRPTPREIERMQKAQDGDWIVFPAERPDGAAK